MASDILSATSAPHFAAQFSNTAFVIMNDLSQYTISQVALNMHTTWFANNVVVHMGQKFILLNETPTTFHIFIFWTLNGKLPDIASSQVRTPLHDPLDDNVSLSSDEGNFDSEEELRSDEEDSDEDLPLPKDDSRGEYYEHDSEEKVPDAEDPGNHMPAAEDIQDLFPNDDGSADGDGEGHIRNEGRSILADWLDAYIFASRIGIPEFCNAIMRRMCQMVWDNTETMVTINEDEAHHAWIYGPWRLRQFVLDVVFLNMKH